MRSRSTRLACAGLACAALVFATAVDDVYAETRPIDVDRSTLTVLVDKAGLFSALGDNHVVRAPITGGSISETAPLGIDISVRTAGLQVIDPGVSADRRAEIQTRMLGRDVLHAAMFPDIIFASTKVEPLGNDAWMMAGNLTIHGQTRTIMFQVVRSNGRYHGQVRVRQTLFGIEPIRVADGAVKVKDEITVQFDIEPSSVRPPLGLGPHRQPAWSSAFGQCGCREPLTHVASHVSPSGLLAHAEPNTISGIMKPRLDARHRSA